MLAVGFEYTVKSAEVDSGFWCQGGQPGEEVQEFEDHMVWAVTSYCCMLSIVRKLQSLIDINTTSGLTRKPTTEKALFAAG